jgi:hypothetical protein
MAAALPRIGLGLLLLGLVGLGSRGFYAAPSARGPSIPGLGLLVLEVLGSLCILAALGGLVLFGAAWSGRRRKRKPKRDRTDDEPRVHWAIKLAAAAFVMTLFAAIVYALATLAANASGAPPGLLVVPGGGLVSFAGQPSDDASSSWPPFGWVFAAVAAVVALVGATCWWLVTRGDQTGTSDTAAEGFVRAFDDGLAALERESDPRRAVILAYVAMERALAAHGLARKSSEAPVEYMLRVLLDVPTCRDPVHRLTDLFEEARFSRHTISGAGRTAALDALLTVRSVLQPTL